MGQKSETSCQVQIDPIGGIEGKKRKTQFDGKVLKISRPKGQTPETEASCSELKVTNLSATLKSVLGSFATGLGAKKLMTRRRKFKSPGENGAKSNELEGCLKIAT